MSLPSTTTTSPPSTAVSSPRYHPIQPPLYHTNPSLATAPRGYHPGPTSSLGRAHPVPVPNPRGYYGQAGVRVFGSGQPAQLFRQPATHPIVAGVPLSSQTKAVPSLGPAPDGNGYKDPRSKDDNFVTIRDRKVRVSGSSSLYAACRSWLRNGVSEESQPHYLDGIKLLPKPSPPPVPDAYSPAEQEPNKGEKEEESVEHLSPKDLLKRHVKHAKKVRARLREERLQRIVRYKTRLALLLPPIVEQQHQFRNESAAGN